MVKSFLQAFHAESFRISDNVLPKNCPQFLADFGRLHFFLAWIYVPGQKRVTRIMPPFQWGGPPPRPDRMGSPSPSCPCIEPHPPTWSGPPAVPGAGAPLPALRPRCTAAARAGGGVRGAGPRQARPPRGGQRGGRAGGAHREPVRRGAVPAGPPVCGAGGRDVRVGFVSYMP